jgi:hypothetical protein
MFNKKWVSMQIRPRSLETSAAGEDLADGQFSVEQQTLNIETALTYWAGAGKQIVPRTENTIHNQGTYT